MPRKGHTEPQGSEGWTHSLCNIQTFFEFAVWVCRARLQRSRGPASPNIPSGASSEKRLVQELEWHIHDHAKEILDQPSCSQGALGSVRLKLAESAQPCQIQIPRAAHLQVTILAISALLTVQGSPQRTARLRAPTALTVAISGPLGATSLQKPAQMCHYPRVSLGALLRHRFLPGACVPGLRFESAAPDSRDQLQFIRK